MIIALTNLFGAPGGIPAFNRLLVHAAWEWTRDRGLPLTVLAMMDPPVTDAAQRTQVLPEGGSRRPRYRAFAGDRRRFSTALLRALHLHGGERPRLCLGHVNLAPLGLLALPPLGRGFAVVAHGTEVWTPLSLPRRLALRRARAVACVSDHTARMTQREQGVDPARTLRIINALDPWRFPEPTLAPAAAPASAPLRLLSVTRLEPTEPKGVDLVLRALPRLPGVRYTVIGEGAARPGLEALAQRLGVAERVRFLGRVSDEARAAALQGCDVFALPSAGEGFGIVYLEAMTYGKPCLAAAAGGAPEVVLDGQTGVVVAPQEDAVLAGLQRLCADAGLRAALGAAGHARLRERFTYPSFRAAAAVLFERL